MFDKLKLLLLKVAFDTVCKERDKLKDKLQAERMRCEALLRENVELGEQRQRLIAECQQWKGWAYDRGERVSRLISQCADMEQNAIRLMGENQQLRVQANAFVSHYVQD